MGRRSVLEAEPRPYKYMGDKDQGIRAHEQCEMAEENHVAKPAHWPPVRKGRQGEDPYVECLCVNCGVNLQVYAQHATGELGGVKVILPQPKKASA